MASEVLKNVAEGLKSVDVQIAEAHELISALKEAGENTMQLETDLRALVIRKDRWVKMLKARGL